MHLHQCSPRECVTRGQDVPARAAARRDVSLQLNDGRWVTGILQYGREVEGVWSWFVRYDDEFAITRLGWFQEPRIWSVE